MRSCGNLSLKNSYKYLQKRMWEISQKASEINKQNEILKGRVSTQRVMIKKRKVQTFYTKNMQQQQTKKVALGKNFQQSCKVNLKLKQKISSLEQQRKQIMEKIGGIERLEKKHGKLEADLSKYSKKLKRMQGQCQTSFPKNRLLKQHEQMNQTISVVEKEESGLIQQIQKMMEQLDEQKRYNKFVSSEVLNLIEQKGKLKKRLKIEREIESSKSKRK